MADFKIALLFLYNYFIFIILKEFICVFKAIVYQNVSGDFELMNWQRYRCNVLHVPITSELPCHDQRWESAS